MAQATALNVLDTEGQTVDLLALAAERPLLVVFLRHFG